MNKWNVAVAVGCLLAGAAAFAETRTWIKTDTAEDYRGTAWSNGGGVNWQDGVLYPDYRESQGIGSLTIDNLEVRLVKNDERARMRPRKK